MDAVVPGIAEGAHLFRLAGDVVRSAIPHIARGGTPLEVRVELDAIGRVNRRWFAMSQWSASR